MRFSQLLQYKSVQAVLFLISLISLVSLTGAFVLGRCSGSEPIQGIKEKVIIKEQKYYNSTEQCRDVLPGLQCWCSCFPQSPFQCQFQPQFSSQPFGQSKAEPENFFEGEDGSNVCAGDLVPAVQATVKDLTAQAIFYGVGPLSDCSGIFHRVLLGVQKRCPDQEYPSVKQYRDSRELARWYHEQGELILIKNAVVQSDLIRPGMALFFGRTGVKYKNASAKILFSSQYGIYHVGVVARVYRDKKGKVVWYELFHGHGRKGKTKASITKWHKRRPTRASYPPFGNGRQQLVAATWIVPVKKALEVVEQ